MKTNNFGSNFFAAIVFQSGWLLGAAALLRDGGEVGCSSNPL